MALAKSAGTCACGNPNIFVGETHVRHEGSRITHCEDCTPECLTEEDTEEGQHRLLVRIRKVRFMSDDGSYVVTEAQLEKPRESGHLPSKAYDSFSVVGPLGPVKDGDVCHVFGEFISDRKYGFQFKAEGSAQLAFQDSDRALVSFLARFPQIGEYRAREILTIFGGLKGVLDMLDNEPQRLTEVKGITEERAKEVKAAYEGAKAFRDFMLWANTHEIPEYIAAAAMEAWGEEAKQNIEEDPYCLQDLEGVTFTKVDSIAQHIGTDKSDPRRVRAALQHVLNTAVFSEHTYIDREELLAGRFGKTQEKTRALDASREALETALQTLSKGYTRRTRKGSKVFPPLVLLEGEKVYSYILRNAEKSIARRLGELQAGLKDKEPLRVPEGIWGDLKPAQEQEEALQAFGRDGIHIMTGGPGVGKTLTTRAALVMLDTYGIKVKCLAPTGKAAMRLKELTGRPASTIHLELAKLHGAREGDTPFIDAGAVVIDESSMVDLELASSLLQALKPGTRLLIVGDVNQLPSVSPGQVLSDLIESKAVSVTVLTQIFRQQSDGQAKRIPEVARDIREGEMPDLGMRGTNVVFVPEDNTEALAEHVVSFVTDRLPKKYGWKPSEIQVIAAQKGEPHAASWAIGTRGLNIALQNALNPRQPGGVELHIGDGYQTRVNDRVIQRKNNYELGVVNGEQGTVVRLGKTAFVPSPGVVTAARMDRAEFGTPASTVTGEKATTCCVVNYGDRSIGYTREEMRDLQLAYAITAHSSQGSQWKAVILVVHDAHGWMLTRRLVYTALTRAEEYVLILGQAKRMQQAVRSQRDSRRRSDLLECLAEVFPSS